MKGETNMSGTIWALVPPIVAIALALWTKEVYLSLLIGILSGALLFTKFHIIAATQTMIEVMNWKIGDNVNILLFLVFLGIIRSPDYKIRSFPKPTETGHPEKSNPREEHCFQPCFSVWLSL